MDVLRTLRHLCATRVGTRRRFSDAVDASIAAAITAAESRTSAEIRFAIETALDIPELWAGVSPRERALQVFSDLRVWDTELRNGVLIYVLAADRDVEIVVDRAALRISPVEWEAACKLIEGHFRAGRFKEGAVAGVEAVGELLAREFPARGGDRDELPNQPSLL
ncbi:MAG TPA: TPM domain-containing protein [Steroidobacteraceae bacterium]|nr:TPM domain-containing protein [Steroidobacteraceae bacterium]